jgi:large subunit ribosomal protein L27
MAHRKAGGSTALGRDSQPQYLGIKIQDGQFVKSGNIIVRQRGFKYRPGIGVSVGKDDTIYAMIDGLVKFTKNRFTKFTGKTKKVTTVNVLKSL